MAGDPRYVKNADRVRNRDELVPILTQIMATRSKADWLAGQWSEPRQDADGTTRWHILGDAAHRVVNPQLYRVEEALALYAHISAPTLMIEAEDDSLPGWWNGKFTLDEFHERLKSVPDLRRVVLPDCGHMLHHDQPERLAREIEGFLQAA